MTQLTRTERLDRLPWSAKHSTLLGASGVGWALDAMDIGLISFIMVAVVEQWQPSQLGLSILSSIGFVGMAVGASVGGLLADRFGRRQIFAVTMLIYGILTGLSALSTGLVMLIILRLFVGFGLGGELPIASTLVSEFAPRKIRGRVVVALESFWAVGWLAAACIGYFLVPGFDDGWRWALALGMIPAAWSLVVRFSLPESVRFLESKGRHTKAEEVVSDFEVASGITTPEASKAPDTPQTTTSKVSWRDLWGVRFRNTTIALWLVWFGVNFSYYGAFIWLPTLLHQNGMEMVQSFGFVLWMTLAQLPGYLAAAILVEKLGRRATLVTFLAGSALGAVLFGSAPAIAEATASGDAAVAYAITLGAACLLSFFNLGAWGALYALTPEVYPTTVRASGSGSATAFGRIAAMLAPLLVPVINGWGGLTWLFIVLGIMFAIAMVAAVYLPEYRGRELEEA